MDEAPNDQEKQVSANTHHTSTHALYIFLQNGEREGRDAFCNAYICVGVYGSPVRVYVSSVLTSQLYIA